MAFGCSEWRYIGLILQKSKKAKDFIYLILAMAHETLCHSEIRSGLFAKNQNR